MCPMVGHVQARWCALANVGSARERGWIEPVYPGYIGGGFTIVNSSLLGWKGEADSSIVFVRRGRVLFLALQLLDLWSASKFSQENTLGWIEKTGKCRLCPNLCLFLCESVLGGMFVLWCLCFFCPSSSLSLSLALFERSHTLPEAPLFHEILFAYFSLLK